jgi:hypothetical protein
VSGEEVTLRSPTRKERSSSTAAGSKSASPPPIAAGDQIIRAYNVECRIGDTSTLHTVKVEKYVLPKFNIGITLDKSFYAPGEQVTGTIQADYFFGQPVAKGDVKIDVRATDVQIVSLASIADTTNDKGQRNSILRFPTTFRPRTRQRTRFMLVASVTDTAGQTYSRGRIASSRRGDRHRRDSEAGNRERHEQSFSSPATPMVPGRSFAEHQWRRAYRDDERCRSCRS